MSRRRENAAPKRRFAPTALMLGNVVTGTSVLAPAGMLGELSSGLDVTIRGAALLITFGAIVLAAIGMPGMPFVAELSVALLVLMAFLVVGVFVFRLREHFESLDLRGIEEIERRGR